MLVTVEVPDEMAHHLRTDDVSRSRQFLEALLLEKYRAGKISGGKLGNVLGMSFYEREQFLHDHQAFQPISPKEFEQELAALDLLKAR